MILPNDRISRKYSFIYLSFHHSLIYSSIYLSFQTYQSTGILNLDPRQDTGYIRKLHNTEERN